jgi:hypothetical protein
MPLVIILDEARRLLYPIQFFLIVSALHLNRSRIETEFIQRTLYLHMYVLHKLEIQTSRYLHLCVHPSIPAYRAAPTPRTDAHALAASGVRDVGPISPSRCTHESSAAVCARNTATAASRPALGHKCAQIGVRAFNGRLRISASARSGMC